MKLKLGNQNPLFSNVTSFQMLSKIKININTVISQQCTRTKMIEQCRSRVNPSAKIHIVRKPENFVSVLESNQKIFRNDKKCTRL